MISREKAIKVVEEYLELPFNQLEDIKIPIYKSWRKRFMVSLLKIYGKIRSRKYFESAIIEPDGLKVITDKLVILSNGIWEGEICWMISYNSKFYEKTNNLMYLRLGIGPIIIDKISGEAYGTGSGDEENLVEDFAKFKNGEKSLINWEVRRL